MDKSIDIAEGSIPLKNAKHENLCHELLIDENGQAAGVKAGYAKNSARITVSQLITKPNISARLAYLRAERNKGKRMTADDIRRELEYCAKSRVGDVVSWNDSGMAFVKSSDDIEDSAHAAIEMIEVTESGAGGEDSKLALKTKVKMHSKLKALDMLNKMDGAYVEKIEISADDDFTNALAQALNKRGNK